MESKGEFEEFGRKEKLGQQPPNAEEAKLLRGEVRDNLVPCKADAEWFKQVEVELKEVNI